MLDQALSLGILTGEDGMNKPSGRTQKTQAKICIKMPSECHAHVIFQALKPESSKQLTHRSKVDIVAKGKNIILEFYANDTSALRAAMNSYLHWVLAIRDTCLKIEELE